ncbi:MAG: hypothetical protein WBQ44_12475, partial [Rhodococcus sp. (in: high G+C Gram-positive bacteria)]
TPRRVHPMPVVEAIVAAAETVVPDPTPFRGAPPEEVGLIARWLDSDGVRIVSATHGYAEPSRGAGAWRQWCSVARTVARREHSALEFAQTKAL